MQWQWKCVGPSPFHPTYGGDCLYVGDFCFRLGFRVRDISTHSLCHKATE
jgi:hypothetical protein